MNDTLRLLLTLLLSYLIWTVYTGVPVEWSERYRRMGPRVRFAGHVIIAALLAFALGLIRFPGGH